MLRKALGMKPSSILSRAVVLELQKKVGVKQDGSWGVKTSKAVQKMVGTTVDGAFGVKSVKALQKWINKQNGYSNPKKKTEPKKDKPKAEPTQGDKIADTAESYIGKVKYVKGGKSLKTGCDCTGFVQVIHKKNGITLKVSDPWGKSVGKDVSKAKRGDVIYYYMNGKLHHMGIYVGNNKVVHNSTSHKDWTKDVCKSSVKMPGMSIGDIRRCWK
jgi:cell wall-associated NlpC family hydrolase